jgi:hypothetical protein
MNFLAVIPSEVEESRGVAFGYCCEIPRLRFTRDDNGGEPFNASTL